VLQAALVQDLKVNIPNCYVFTQSLKHYTRKDTSLATLQAGSNYPLSSWWTTKADPSCAAEKLPAHTAAQTEPLMIHRQYTIPACLHKMKMHTQHIMDASSQARPHQDTAMTTMPTKPQPSHPAHGHSPVNKCGHLPPTEDTDTGIVQIHAGTRCGPHCMVHQTPCMTKLPAGAVLFQTRVFSTGT
jgi:hypothetical protein